MRRASGKSAVRLLIAILACILSFHGGFAQQLPDREVCVADPDVALQNAEAFHELGTRQLMSARGAPWSGTRLDRIGPRAEAYVRRREGESLILYARDSATLCAFLWHQDDAARVSMLYARMPGGAGRLEDLGEEFRSLVAAGVAASGRALTRQAMEADGDGEPSSRRDVTAIAAELADLLFPVSFRPALSTTRSLSVVPVGAMSTIPLALLPPLGDARTGTDLFSLNVLTLAEDIDTKLYGWIPSFSHALILGDPVTSLPSWSFPALPGARMEAGTAHAIFGGTLRMGREAGSGWLQQEGGSAELIVVAAHGVADPDDPIDGSFLALSDGPLTPREIMGLQLSAAPLVVLSACQSGLGRAMDAGVIGLARAFQIAGATNTVMSLWNVDDEATRFLMEHFYGNLRTMTPSAALREAALATRESYPDPMKWAAFQVFGVSTVLRPKPQ